MEVGGSLGCSGRVTTGVTGSRRIPKGGSRAKSRTTSLHVRGADFNLFRDLLRRIPWDMTMERRGVQESWLMRKGPFQQVGDQRQQESCLDEQRAAEGIQI